MAQQQRLIFAFMTATAVAITYGLKVNFHLLIIAMINHTAVAHTSPLSGNTDTSPESGNSSSAWPPSSTTVGLCPPGDPLRENVSTLSTDDGPFLWNSVIEGRLLGAYFYGYILTQIVGAKLAQSYSAKYTFGFSLLINIVLAMVSPLAAGIHWMVLLVARFIQGLAGGVTLPVTHVLLSKWLPSNEQARLSSFVFAGMPIGTVISTLTSGLLVDLFGWEMAFYLPTALASLHCIAWWLLVYDSPDVHPWISEDEKQFIRTHIVQVEHSDKGGKVPWIPIFRSMPFWAVFVSHVGNNCGWYLLLTSLPKFMSSMLSFDIKSNAVLSALPFFFTWLFSLGYGFLLDYLRARRLLTRTQAAKISTCIGAYIPAVCLCAVTYVGCRRYMAVSLLTITVASMGSIYNGFMSNHIDLAPDYAGILMAVTNTAATIPGFVVPEIVGVMTEKQNTIIEWRYIFFGTSTVLTLHAIFYTLFASGELQPWSQSSRRETIEELTLELKDSRGQKS